MSNEMEWSSYRPAIFRYLVACLGDTEAANDLCQEFYRRVVHGDFRNGNPVKGRRFRDLIKSSLYQLIIDYHKRRQRGMPQLSPEAPEPSADSASTLDSDRQFLDVWRKDLLDKAWEKLADEEQRTGRPMHTVLHYRAAHLEMRSAQMAEQLSAQLGKKVTGDWVRMWLHTARERFAEFLLEVVTASLRNATKETIVQELIDLELFEYCKIAVDRWQERRTP
jgi:RNA polymerase sigma-70 factor (ECF subfamily)